MTELQSTDLDLDRSMTRTWLDGCWRKLDTALSVMSAGAEKDDQDAYAALHCRRRSSVERDNQYYLVLFIGVGLLALLVNIAVGV